MSLNDQVSQLFRDGKIPGFGRVSVRTLAAIDGGDVQKDHQLRDGCTLEILFMMIKSWLPSDYDYRYIFIPDERLAYNMHQQKVAGGNEYIPQCMTCQKRETSSEKLLLCSGCKKVHYCSPDCQRSHWKHKTWGHKKACKKMSDGPYGGRVLNDLPPSMTVEEAGVDDSSFIFIEKAS